MKRKTVRRNEYDRYKKHNINNRRRKKGNKISLLGVIIIIAVLAAFVYGCNNFDLFGNGESSSDISNSNSEPSDSSKPSDSSSQTDTSEQTSSEISSRPEDSPGYPFSQIKYYISDRIERYIEFSSKNPDLSLEEAVIRVNMNFDYAFYEMIYPVKNPDDKLVLVNKYYQLAENFVPANLKEIHADYHIGDGKLYLLDETALNAFIEMAEAARVEGIELRILSAYRSFSLQQSLYNAYVERDGFEKAEQYSARAGHSEHQTGLAVDVNLLSQDFESLPEFLWLRDNSYKFGYILRYKQGYEWETGYMYEPWHYRYVGKEVAKNIFEEDITFDRYYAKYILPFKN